MSSLPLNVWAHATHICTSCKMPSNGRMCAFDLPGAREAMQKAGLPWPEKTIMKFAEKAKYKQGKEAYAALTVEERAVVWPQMQETFKKHMTESNEPDVDKLWDEAWGKAYEIPVAALHNRNTPHSSNSKITDSQSENSGA